MEATALAKADEERARIMAESPSGYENKEGNSSETTIGIACIGDLGGFRIRTNFMVTRQNWSG
jgi:hypothetical protein